MLDEVELIIGGPQGSGIETSMWILTLSLARKGYGVIAGREYFSNITGRHSYIHMKASSRELPRSLSYPVDLLTCMDTETLFTHFDDLSEKGFVIYDKSILGKNLREVYSMEDYTKQRISRKLRGLGLDENTQSIVRYLGEQREVSLIELDYAEILKKLTEKYTINPRYVSRYISTILAASIVTILDLDVSYVEYALRRRFGDRVDLLEQNLYVTKLTSERVIRYRGRLKLREPVLKYDKLMTVTGNDIVAMGKMIGGVRYQSYYPITPAADESFLLEKYEVVETSSGEIGPIVVMQTEDEIAAITSAIGAALTGTRSSTATSGPGYDLMIEGIGWAGMNEVPVVVTYYQRGGPSTGQPTRGSQSDLFNAIFSGHGEFARIVLSSSDHVEAFYDAIYAFNMAEKYQVPVIHLLDKFLANTLVTTPIPDLEKISIERGLISSGGVNYKRFDLEYTVSPRAFLGTPNTVMWYTGDEHDEYGHISEDPELRAKMYSKRLGKIELIRKETPRDLKIRVYGGGRDLVIVGWGSIKGVVLDVLKILKDRGIDASYIDVKLLHPFPSNELLEILRDIREDRIVTVEHSYLVSISNLITMNTGIVVKKQISKYTGRPMYLNEIVDAIDSILFKGLNRVEVYHGA